ncbi:extracellular solute-binding protein [Psychromarinibacter sp. C21-152]|uniref:Extracellular solute-binding protein n=1 Tax=Psychromarinibacter sediminicola TaxID=3033385 RepID=A0AAE3T8L6_9RHOB|nr:extracellular solute-binding protein [Psychromarinibacter sediminicola]MDF0601387.1 extracellular solute-binding protein [Psychromarinibacter sediminicola]
MRRFSLLRLALPLVLVLLLAQALPAAAADLTVVSWGGSYEAAQRRAVIAPFEAETGIATEVVQYDGTAAAIARRAAAEGWDVIDMLSDQARVACAAGLLQEIDAAALLGRAALADFAPAGPTRCAIPQNVYARVMAYDERAFPGVKPSRIGDFFDTDRFPGKRAVQRGPDGILEWALLAEGVPPEQVYGLLSTDRGLRLAMRRLDAIRDDIVWWTDPAEPAAMLADGRAVMAAGFNGRFFDAARSQAAPINIVWDGRIIGIEVWAIAASTDAPEAARAFLAHALGPDAMARLAERIPYGPARRSAFERIGQNPETGAPMRVFLPNAPGHGARALVRDSLWYANTEELRTRRFESWLDGDR